MQELEKIPEISQEVLQVLMRLGINSVISFDVDGPDESIEKIEKELKSIYPNAVINVFKVGRGKYRVEIFMLENVNELKRVAIESYLYLSALERFAVVSKNKDFEYFVKRFIRSYKKYLNEFAGIFERSKQ